MTLKVLAPPHRPGVAIEPRRESSSNQRSRRRKRPNPLPDINTIDDDLAHSGQVQGDINRIDGSANANLAEGILKKGLTLQSDLGVEELSFAGLIANHMINTWYLYSKRIASRKFNLAHVSKEENEIEIDDPVLLDLFRHLEKTIEDETRLVRRTSFVYQQRFAPAWWEIQAMTEESLVEPK